MGAESTLNYVSYLRLEQILTAQAPRSTTADGFEHDEMLFIIIHQVYELWFKQILHEIDYLAAALYAGERTVALHTMRRLLTILKTVVSQIDILETMTPLQFNSFRAFLETSSGFQSVQFRELEFLLGHKRLAMLKHFPVGLHGRDRLAARYHEPTLWDAFLSYLNQKGHAMPPEQLARDVTRPVQASPEIQKVLMQVYRTDPEEARTCERMIDMDEGLQEWRYRHVKMVARTIGNKPGTGGSSGVTYLESTLNPLWPDLWAIRAHL